MPMFMERLELGGRVQWFVYVATLTLLAIRELVSITHIFASYFFIQYINLKYIYIYTVYYLDIL